VGVRERELHHHEQLYSGFAQQHFAKAAVRALRRHMVQRIVRQTGAGPDSRVLSAGCGIGDTELLLAPYVRDITGIDLSPAAIRQAREDAAGSANVRFLEATLETCPAGPYDVVIGIFFLHHMPDLDDTARRIGGLLRPGGVFYGLDPSRYRLSGALGRLVVPHLMRRYQTPDERELRPREVRAIFSRAGFSARTDIYDFASSPLAGLLPSFGRAYRAARALDEVVIRVPGLRALGSNFEVIARKP
jgi:SAM-dependent methyltransferase